MSTETGPYRIEISTEKGSLQFGPRIFGEAGKDILAVKIALGVVQNIDGRMSQIVEGQEDVNIPMDQNNWFDCSTGTGISMQQAARFGSKMETALTNFQIKNQFLILCYLFEKYGVKNIIGEVGVGYHPITLVDQEEFSEGIIRQIDAIQVLFDKELGTLGEATLAVMHGWLPLSTISNTGYSHSSLAMTLSESPNLYDVIPEVLAVDFEQGLLGQTLSDLESVGYVEGSLQYDDQESLVKYLNLVPESQKWISEGDSVFLFASLVYRKTAPGSMSALYSAAVQSISDFAELDLDFNTNTREQSTEQMRRMFYPDPFSTEETFYINSEKTGFYMETEYSLDPNSEIPNYDPETIESLEEQALDLVLAQQSRPVVWFLPVDNSTVKSVTFGSDKPTAPNHAGVYPLGSDDAIKQELLDYKEIKKQIKALEEEYKGLNPFADLENLRRQMIQSSIATLEAQYAEAPTAEQKAKGYFILSSQRGSAIALPSRSDTPTFQSWREVDGFGNEPPLIKFVEYRTPSMRPGQRYRAMFELSTKKLEIISEGIVGDTLTTESQQGIDSSPSTTLPETCGTEGLQESRRTLQEYRVHARRKRREIVRKLREKFQEEERLHGKPTVDLGTYGPFNLNNALKSVLGFDINGGTDYEYTQNVVSRLGDVGTAALQELGFMDTDIEYFNQIANEANKEITETDASGSKKANGYEITLQELEERAETIKKDLQESAQIIESEGIVFKKGSNFNAQKEAGLVNQFVTDFKDLILSNAEDYYGKVVADRMREKPEDAIVYLTFQFVEPDKPSNKFLGPKYGKKIIEYAISFPIDYTINGEPWFSEARSYNSEALPGPANFIEEDTKQKMIVPDINLKKINETESLSRPRTINYISNIFEMTGLLTDRPGEVISIFDDGRGACKDLGLNFEKRQASSYVAKFTSGIQVKALPGSGEGLSWAKFAKEQFVDPAKDWYDKGASNWESSWNDSFDEAAALKAMGKMCTLEDLYKEFFDKLDLISLLCDYIKCIRFPNFNIQLPNFYLPPFPDIPILGWYSAMLRFLRDQIKQILTRLACSFVRAIIDKLAIPFCEEQLRDFIAAGSLSESPVVNQALAAALLDTGIPGDKAEEAKQFFDDVASITTGEELCHLMSGRPLDDASMMMVRRLVDKNQLAGDLVSEEDILNYFDLMGTLLPSGLCEELTKSQTLAIPKTCVEVSDYLSDIRNRLKTGDTSLSDEEIERAVQMAQDELEQKQRDLRAFSGNSIGNLLPNAYGPGDPNSIISEYPDFLKEELDNTVKNSFSSARTSYVNALGAYVPAMSMTTPLEPKAGTDKYSDEQSLSFDAALTQLALYTTSLGNSEEEIRSHIIESLGPGVSDTLREDPSKIDQIIEFGPLLNRKLKRLRDLITVHSNQFIKTDDYNRAYWNGIFDETETDEGEVIPVQWIDGPGPMGIHLTHYGLSWAGDPPNRLSATNGMTNEQKQNLSLSYGSVDQLAPGGLHDDFLQQNGFQVTYYGQGFTPAARHEMYSFIRFFLRDWLTDKDPGASLWKTPELESRGHVFVDAFSNKLEDLARTLRDGGNEANLREWTTLNKNRFVLLGDNDKASVLEALASPKVRDYIKQMTGAFQPWTREQSTSFFFIRYYGFALFHVDKQIGSVISDEGLDDSFPGFPFISFKQFADYSSENVWNTLGAFYGLSDSDLGSEEAQQRKETFLRYRTDTSIINKIDILIEEYEKKTNAYETWSHLDMSEIPLRLGKESDDYDTAHNPYISGYPTEQDFIDNFIVPQQLSEAEGVPWNDTMRGLPFLEFMIRYTEPGVDLVSVSLTRLGQPSNVYWYNAILLYTLFETEEVPFETRPDLTHRVHVRNKLLHEPGEPEYVANIERVEGSVLDQLIDVDPSFRNEGEIDPSGRGRLVIRQIEGMYNDVFNPTPSSQRLSRRMSYEEYYESITNPDSSDDFVLNAIPLTNVIDALPESPAIAAAHATIEISRENINLIINSMSYHPDYFSAPMFMGQIINLFEEAASGVYDALGRAATATTPPERSVFSLLSEDYRVYLMEQAATTSVPNVAGFLAINRCRDIVEELLESFQFVHRLMEVQGTTGVGSSVPLPLIAASLRSSVEPENKRLESTLEVVAEMFHAITNSQISTSELSDLVFQTDLELEDEETETKRSIYEKILRASTVDGLNEQNLGLLSAFISIMNNEPNNPGLIKMVNERINFLSNRVVDGIRNKPAEVTNKHLLILDKLMKNSDIFSRSGNEIQLFIEAGVYKPKITYIEHPASENLERYDVEISSDFHLGQATSAALPKVFKFCEKLPQPLVARNLPIPEQFGPGENVDKYFSKREAFAQMCLTKFQEYNFVRAEEAQVKPHSSKEKLYDEIFKRRQDDIIRSLSDELEKSRLFNLSYATTVDERLSAKPTIDDAKLCVTNRYGLIESSVMSFDKTILLESYMEIMKETAKPENSPFNRDFDDPAPIDLALQSICLKAFVRVCLIDTLLKGGLAYAVWDIEPIVSDSLFLEYVCLHTEQELNQSLYFRDFWKTNIERVVGITNPKAGLKFLIQQEIVKLPDFSKQVFNFDRKQEDFFDWYVDNMIGYRHIKSALDTRTLENFTEVEDVSFQVPVVPPNLSNDSFYFEDYVKLRGQIIDRQVIINAKVQAFELDPLFIDTATASIFEEATENESELYIPTHVFDSLIRLLRAGLSNSSFNSVISGSSIYHGIRLVMPSFSNDLITKVRNYENVDTESVRTRSFLTGMQVTRANPGTLYRDAQNDNYYLLSCHIPVAKTERQISLSDCEIAFSADPETGLRTREQRNYMKSLIKQDENFKYLLENIFPVKRYMSINSIFATSLLSGYNGMPSLFAPTKIAIAFMGSVVSTPTTQRDNLVPLTQEDFTNLVINNWPSHPESSSCFQLPGLSGEFFKQFFKDLWKLITQLPSILFRGVANVIDPAYKEMRQHYLNCDIEHLTWDGLTAESYKSGLTNGLLLKGDPGQNSGFYAPIVFTGVIDMLASTGLIFRGEWRPMLRTVLKTMSYAYSGQLPFLDPSYAFQIPCLGINENYRPDEIYDMGKYGRYGHPMTPFTILALSTYQLDSDKNLKRPNCVPTPIEEYEDC